MLPLSKLDSKKLESLVSLHCSVMHTLLSDLGPAMVLRYYQIAQSDPSVIGICSLSNEGVLNGWAMGSSDPAALNSKLRQPAGRFISQMLQTTFKRPAVILDLLRSVFSASDANKLSPRQVELTYIGVSPLKQGQGLGQALLQAFIERSRQAGYQSIALSVETDNPAALSLYRRYNFQITRSFHEGRFERHRMALTL